MSTSKVAAGLLRKSLTLLFVLLLLLLLLSMVDVPLKDEARVDAGLPSSLGVAARVVPLLCVCVRACVCA